MLRLKRSEITSSSSTNSVLDAGGVRVVLALFRFALLFVLLGFACFVVCCFVFLGFV